MPLTVTPMISDILKDGLRQYKYKNSHLKPVGHQESMKKGAIFTYRSKENMANGRGLVLTSDESLIENEDCFSHWTPNVYRYGTYVDKNRSITKGHSENNLRQINTFYIDFDSLEITSNDILTTAIDMGMLPTLILKSTRGYQAYFVLPNAAYVTATSQFKVVKVAKMISQNLRDYFAQTLPVDMACNHFGIARIPRTDNVEFYDKNYMYSFETWLNWSMKQSDNKQNTRKVVGLGNIGKPNLSVLTGSEGKRQIDEPWFDLLLHSSKIEGSKDVYGRNNVIFTLSLAYYSSGYSIETCEYNMFEFNERLANPLLEKEITKSIKSAYSGKYQAARRDFIILLCKEWVSPKLTSQDLFINQKWVKFKKPRHERKRVHLSEWKDDLMTYINDKAYTYKPYVVTTKKAIREDLGIPERSLDKLLTQLKKSQEIFFKVKHGRGGGIMVASVKTLLASIIKMRKEDKESYLQALTETFRLKGNLIHEMLQNVLERHTDPKNIELFHLDSG